MRALSDIPKRPLRDGAGPRYEPPAALRFLTEIVAWVATPWALASHSPVLAGAAVLLLIGLPTVFATPGDKVKVYVAVPGPVTIALSVLQLAAAALASWAAWPVPVALLVWVLVGATVYAEIPRWERLAGGELVISRPLHLINEGLAFVIELLALAAFAWWGAEAGSGPALHLILGIGGPLVAAVFWWFFAAPKAKVRLPIYGVLAAKGLVFVLAVLCLAGLGHRVLAAVFGLVAAVNTVVAALDRDAAIQKERREDASAAPDQSPIG